MIVSHTMSASLRPVCGRARWEFSILTATAGRSGSASVFTPVSGQTTGTTGVGGASRDAVTDGVTVIGGGASGVSDAHPARVSRATAAVATVPDRSRRCRRLWT